MRTNKPMWTTRPLGVLLVLCLMGFLSTGVSAQLQQSQIEVLADEVKNNQELGQEQRAALLGKLGDAGRALGSAGEYRASTEQLQAKIENSQSQIDEFERLARDIQRAPASVASRLGDRPDLAAIQAEIGAIESQRSTWTRERTETLDLSGSISIAEAQRRDRLAEIASQLPELRADTSDTQVTDVEQRVRAASVAARREMLEAEEELIGLQQRGEPMLAGIRTARIAWLDAAINDADLYLTELRKTASEKRQSAATQGQAETRRILGELDKDRPELSAIANENLEQSARFQDLASQIEEARTALASLRLMKESIDQDANLTRRRLGVAGLESELGEIMLSRLESLPDSRLLNNVNRKRSQRIAALSINAIDTEQAIRALSDPQETLRGEDHDFENWPNTEKRTAVRLLEQRRRLLQANLEAENTLVRQLVDGNQAAIDLAAATDEYEKFLTANLLWVRNYSFVSPDRVREQFSTLWRAIPRVGDADWPGAAGDLYLVITLIVLLVTLFRRRASATALTERLGKPIAPRDEGASLIFKSLLLTLVISLPVPLIMVLVSRILVSVLTPGPVIAGIASTLQWAAVVYLSIEVLQRVGDRLGAGRRLLKWNGSKIDVGIRDLGWFKITFVIATLMIGLGRASSPTDSGAALSALGSAVMVLSLLIVSMRMHATDAYDNDTLAKVALRVCIVASAAITLMHLSGQIFAAHLYLLALVGSIGAILAVLFVTSTLQRLLLINQARLQRKAKDELRALESEADDNADELAEQGSDLEAVSSLSDAYLNLLALSRLLGIATLLWLIWSPALPALDVFDAVTLWTAEDPNLPAGELRDITVSVLLLALVAGFVTVFVTRHLPPLINVMLMEWTGVSAGGRYAAGMLTQYVIIGVGLSVTLGLLGFQWSKVQWLVAALGVGIGFGLQEIVANFISGLIVLFERPIRVGDIIMAGGYEGTVTKINPRATVVRTFERKEVMIPNKELITSAVTNWSLSDTNLRVLITVGVAYGSDVGQAMRILLAVAVEHPEILDEPESKVTFEDFGDNALVLRLRCYAPDDYLRVGTELREEIYKRLNAAGIGISFPQRDVHLDADNPIPVQIMAREE